MKTVLIVDDDSMILETLQYLLLNEGYDAIIAKNGQEAIEKYKETNPAIVLMDIKMPIMNGFDAFFKIKDLDKDARVILTSAYAIDDGDYQHAKKLGLAGLLPKPFTIDKIVKMMKKFQD